jgi:hypothetical protein
MEDAKMTIVFSEDDLGARSCSLHNHKAGHRQLQNGEELVSASCNNFCGRYLQCRASILHVSQSLVRALFRFLTASEYLGGSKSFSSNYRSKRMFHISDRPPKESFRSSGGLHFLPGCY